MLATSITVMCKWFSFRNFNVLETTWSVRISTSIKTQRRLTCVFSSFLCNQQKKFLHWKAWTSDFPAVHVGGSGPAQARESGLLLAQGQQGLTAGAQWALEWNLCDGFRLSSHAGKFSNSLPVLLSDSTFVEEIWVTQFSLTFYALVHPLELLF